MYKMKKHNQSPLPFQGQKRRFLKKFTEALKDYPSEGIYVDLFGGSGLLSHTVKEFYPNSTVIWNDFDDFQTRLENVDKTNKLLSKIRPLLDNEPRNKKIKEPIRQQILDIIVSEPWVDYVTLSANILFSGKYIMNFEELERETFYNVIRRSDYNVDNYLVGVKRVQDDYKRVYKRFKDVPNVVFLVDPPYLSTDTKSYNFENYWKLRDYLDVLNVLDSSDYFYFTSNKSQIVELCEWVETRTSTGNPFAGATVTTTAGNVNYSSGYTDVMLHKLV